jgi:hypothetical protein
MTLNLEGSVLSSLFAESFRLSNDYHLYAPVSLVCMMSDAEAI